MLPCRSLVLLLSLSLSLSPSLTLMLSLPLPLPLYRPPKPEKNSIKLVQRYITFGLAAQDSENPASIGEFMLVSVLGGPVQNHNTVQP